MIKILVSACLVGERVRYDGLDNQIHSHILKQWQEQGRLVTFRPETEGGLGIPRPRSEITDGDGSTVLLGQDAVINEKGDDVTDLFIKGAQEALKFARQHQVRFAVLKENSPSCGSSNIFDGSFSGLKIRGQGVTSALLEQNGIHVFSEDSLQAAQNYLEMLESFS